MADPTIGNWTESQLVKFLRDFQDQQPQQFFNKLRVDQLQVDSLFNLKPTQATLLTNNDYYVIGSQGVPAFQGTWVAWGAGEATPGYWKDPFGFVHLKGIVKSGVIGTTVFTLPPGFRPQEKMLFDTISNGAIGRLDVEADGDVVAVSGNNTYFSLNGKYFRTII